MMEIRRGMHGFIRLRHDFSREQEAAMAGFFSFRGMREDSSDSAARRKERELRKAQRFIRSANEPLVPFFCRLLFFCMLFAPLLDVLLEILEQIRREQKLAAGAFLKRIAGSALTIWAFFGSFVLVLAVIQLVRVARHGYEEKIYRFKSELRPGERVEDYEVAAGAPRRSGGDMDDLVLYAKKACGDTRARYLRYVVVTLAGGAVLGIFYMICRQFAG